MFSAANLAKLLDGIVEGEQDKRVSNVALFNDAKPTDITYIRKKSDLDKINECQAGIIIVPPVITLPLDKTYIKVDCLPEQVVPNLLSVFYAQKKISYVNNIHPNTTISPNTIIGNGVTIGKGTCIGPYVVIEDGVTIGENCDIRAHVYIGENVQIGSNVIICPGTIVGNESFEFIQMPNGTYQKLVNIGTVIVEDAVEIGANTTIDRGTIGNTIIGQGTKIDNLVQIGHEVIIGKNCIIVAQVGIAGWSKIGDYTTIYGQVGIIGEVEVGHHVTVMGKSVVTKNINNHEVVSGNPAIDHKKHLKQQAMLNKLCRKA